MNIKDFQDSLEFLFAAEVTPFIWGHAGIGKTTVVKQYAKKKGYHFFPLYLGTQSDLGDVLGLADFVRDKNGSAVATTFATPNWLKECIEYCNTHPESGAVLFLDEFNRARRDVLQGMFSLALDKTFHTLKMPKNMHIVAAGNPPTDEYYVTDVNETALMARFCHVKLEPTVQEWMEYAKDAKFESTLVSFIQEQPQLLEDKKSEFDLPVKVDRRSYERLNRLFQVNTPVYLLNQLMCGIIGTERAVAYQAHLANQDKPLTGVEVLAGARLGDVSKWVAGDATKSSLFASTCDNVSDYLTDLAKKDVTKLSDDEKINFMKYIRTCPKDLVYVMIKKLIVADSRLFRDFSLTPEYEKEMIAIVRTAKGLK